MEIEVKEATDHSTLVREERETTDMIRYAETRERAHAREGGDEGKR